MRKFLYYILKPDGRSAKVVNGVVTYTGTPTPLPQTPDGWQSIIIAWERSIGDHGLVRNFSLPFGFVRDGLTILRDAIYNQSVEETLYLLIQTLVVVFVPGVSYNWLYEYLYRGELDLAAAEDGQDMIHVPCMEGGLHKMLKANRSTKYTFPFDDEAVSVIHDGMKLDETAHFVVVGQISNTVVANDHTVPVTFVNRDGLGSGTAFFSSVIEDVPGSIETYVATSSNYFMINNTGGPVTYKIKGLIKFICTENTASLAYRLWFTSNGGTADPESVNIFTSGVALVKGQAYEIPIDYSFVLTAGKKYFLFGRFFGAGGVEIAVDYTDESYLDISYESRGAASKILAYTKDVLFKKLIGKITGDENNASSLLCEEKKYTVLTSGDAIRQIVDPEITTSLDDFIADMDACYMAGLAVANGKIEIERRSKYYDTSNPIDLGTIKDLTVMPANEFRANGFKFGHVKPDIEDLNGRFDPNGSNEFSGPLLKSTNEYERISRYKAGPYEIESLRLNLNGKVTTDDNRDTSVYKLNCIANDTITDTVSFIAAIQAFIISNNQFLAAGQQIEITGSPLNSGIYNITAVGSLLVVMLVGLSAPVVDEVAVPVTITILRGAILTLNRPAYSTLEGVPNDTIYNLPDLTPKTMLLTHGRWIRSMHKGLESQSLEFNSGDKNTKLKTVLGAVTIDEDKNEAIADLGEPMFIPFYAVFETEVPVDIVDLLEADPNRCFIAYDAVRDVQIEGFLMAAGFAPNELKEQEFKLLLSPNNDLSLLV